MNYIKNVGDNQNKFGDTATVFQLGLMKDDEVYNFGDNQVTVNIANETGYVLSVTPDKFSQNTILNLDFNKVPLKNLTPDSYRLEVEVKSTDGDIAKFPTSGAMTFSINHDLKETSGELVPTVTFDNVLDAVDEKIAVYMDTVKVGPQGPIGPAGNVDTSNDNTFTGTNTFTKQINGSLSTKTITTPTDLFTLSNGYYYNSGIVNTNSPSNVTFYTIEVIQTSTNGLMFLVDSDGNYYWNTKKTSTWGTWKKVSDDGKVLHNTGTETVAGDKTFTGNSVFTKLIDGYTKTKNAPNTDVNLLISQGKYQVDSSYKNIPTGMPNQAILIVENSILNDKIYQILLSRDVDGLTNGDVDMFLRLNIDNNWTPWRKFAQDQQVLHLSGNETVSGDKTFLSGNYGLRVTTSGIQKTSDGGTTWTNI
jgi:hypothetical protein